MKKITLLAMSFIMALTVKAQEFQSSGTDMTSLLTNPDFESGNAGWTITGSGWAQGTAAANGYNGVNFFESWVSSNNALGDLDWSQEVSLDNGVYVVRALAHAIRQSDTDLVPEGVTIYANNDKVAVTTINVAPTTEYRLLTVVQNGKLKIGFNITKGNVNWAGWDNVRLYLYEAETADLAKKAYVVDEVQYLQEVLEGLIENPMSADLRDAINDSFGEIESVSNYAEANALWNTMKAQAEEAEACVVAYEKLMLKIDELWAMVDDGADELEDVAADAEDMYYGEALSVAEALAEIEALTEAVYMYNLSQADGSVGFDVTDRFVTNPSVRVNTQGWAGSKPALGHEVMEFYNCDFDFHQTITDIPNGKYIVKVQAFYRVGGNDSGAGYQAGSEKITAKLYANDEESSLTSMYKYTADVMGVTPNLLNGYVNGLESANLAFSSYNALADDYYYTENEVSVIVMDGTLTFGLRNVGHAGSSWCAFREFKLEYFGNFPGINLYAKMQKIEDTMSERFDEIPSAVRWEMEDFLASIEEYTEPGYSDEEVNAVILQLDAEWKKVEEAIEVYAELQALFDFADGELLDLEYPGVDDLDDVLDEVYDYLEEDCEENTYDNLVAMLATLNQAVIDYIFSQEASADSPVDMGYFVPVFSETKDYDVAPWQKDIVSKNDYQGDVWQGPMQIAEGAEPVFGINSWHNDFTSMDVYFELENLHNGLYSLSVDAITQGGCANDQHGYLAAAIGVVKTDPLTIEGWDNGIWQTLTSGTIVVTDGKLRVGFASTSTGGTNGWFQFANVKLYYHGEATEADMQAAWENLKEETQESVNILIPNEKGVLAAALAEATQIAEAGNYLEACTMLNPVVEAWDSTIVATKNFYGGYYAKLDTIRLYDAYDGCEMVYEFADVAVALADAILASDTASCKLFPALDAKLHAYANYAAALRDAENEMKNEEAGYKQEYIDLLKESFINPQLAVLKASLIEAADCDAMTEELKQAVELLKSSVVEEIDAEEGLVTYLIANADVESTLDGSWTVVKGGAHNCGTATGEHYSGNAENHYLDAWAPSGNTATFYQNLVGIPNGTYRLTVAARTDGGNVWLFAAPSSKVKDSSTQFVEVIKDGAYAGSIWSEDKLAWEAAGRPTENLTEDYPYFMARYNSETGEGEGYGWNWHVLEVEVTNRYLSIGVSANPEFTGKDAFTGSWFGADDWKLELVKKSDVQSEYNPFLGVENLEVAAPVVKGIYDLFGRRLDAATAPGIYIVNGKKVVIK